VVVVLQSVDIPSMADRGLPLIINLAPTGMVPTKAMTPHVPI
jgi:hypothetical protein